MEQTTLQQRIEERAKRKLLNDMWSAFGKQQDIIQVLGSYNYKEQFKMHKAPVNNYNRGEITCWGEEAQKIFDAKLPAYVTMVTDEILQKIDEIDWLVQQKEEIDYE